MSVEGLAYHYCEPPLEVVELKAVTLSVEVKVLEMVECVYCELVKTELVYWSKCQLKLMSRKSVS